MCQRLIKNSKLANHQIGKLVDLFALEILASKAAKIIMVNRHSVDRIYTFIRQCIARECENNFPLKDAFGIDNSRLLPNMRASNQKHRLPVFGILKLNEKIFTRVVDDIDRETLQRMIRTRSAPPVVAKTKSYRLFQGLILDGRKYYHIGSPTSTTKNAELATGTGNFWGYAKNKLKKYCGINKAHFNLYLKEMEFRYNHRDHADLALLIKKLLKNMN